MTKKIRCATKGEMVYDALYNAIIEGEMKPGEKFSISEVAVKYGISRTPVSEAVKLLESQDLVRILPNVGFQVRLPSKEEISEVLDIRGALEGLAIRKVIQRVTMEDITQLEKIIDKTFQYAKEADIENYLQANEEFHFTLYNLAGSHKLVEALNQYWIHEDWYATDIKKISEKVDILIKDHRELIEVIKNKDYGKVQSLVEKHVEHCREIVVHNMIESGLLL